MKVVTILLKKCNRCYILNLSFNFRNVPKLVTWDLKVRQMGLQKKDLANIMVKELDLTCTPQQYLDESEKLHQTLFPEVSIIMVVRRGCRVSKGGVKN